MRRAGMRSRRRTATTAAGCTCASRPCTPTASTCARGEHAERQQRAGTPPPACACRSSSRSARRASTSCASAATKRRRAARAARRIHLGADGGALASLRRCRRGARPGRASGSVTIGADRSAADRGTRSRSPRSTARRRRGRRAPTPPARSIGSTRTRRRVSPPNGRSPRAVARRARGRAPVRRLAARRTRGVDRGARSRGLRERSADDIAHRPCRRDDQRPRPAGAGLVRSLERTRRPLERRPLAGRAGPAARCARGPTRPARSKIETLSAELGAADRAGGRIVAHGRWSTDRWTSLPISPASGRQRSTHARREATLAGKASLTGSDFAAAPEQRARRGRRAASRVRSPIVACRAPRARPRACASKRGRRPDAIDLRSPKRRSAAAHASASAQARARRRDVAVACERARSGWPTSIRCRGGRDAPTRCSRAARAA